MGFFTAKDFKINNPAALGKGCGKCRLYKTCKTPRMEPYGNGERGIMVIAEAPGETEDERGIPLIGKSGQLLNYWLRKLSIDPERDIVKTNAVCCRPPGNRTPEDHEIDCCRGRVWQLIETLQPKVIIPLGAVAIQSLLGHRWHDDEGGLGGILRWRGWQIPDRDANAWIVPSYHPAYILRMDNNPAAEIVFRNDLKNALRCLDKSLPQYKEESKCVEVITDENKVLQSLEQLLNRADKYKDGDGFLVSTDIETTGLKPFRPGHKIWYIGIADTPDHAIVFPFLHMPKTKRWMRELLCHPAIYWMTHNTAFEDMWFRELLGVQVQTWKWCSMQTAHVLDNRRGISGLKFQAYVQTGLVDYSSHISPYLASTGKELELYGDNGFNNIHKAPEFDTMQYCGIDCIVQYRLAMLQEQQLSSNILSPYTIPF